MAAFAYRSSMQERRKMSVPKKIEQNITGKVYELKQL